MSKQEKGVKKSKGFRKFILITFALIWFISTFGGAIQEGRFNEEAFEFINDIGVKTQKAAENVKLWFIEMAAKTDEGETIGEKVQISIAGISSSAMFVWLPLVGWLLYIIVKLVLACAVGTVTAPYKIGRTISKRVAGA